MVKAIANEKSLKIFCMIASDQTNGSVIRNELNLSFSQLNTKINPMVKVGLLIRMMNVYVSLNWVKNVFQAQLQIENAINKYWELKAIDPIEDVPSIEMQDARDNEEA